MFDPSQHVKPEVPRRTFGHTKAGFGAKPKFRGYKILNEGETQLDTGIPPNRALRRFAQAYNATVPARPKTRQSKAQKAAYAKICQEKQNLKQAIKQSKLSWDITHRPHRSYWAQYFSPEEVVRLKQEAPPEELAAAKRYIKNALKRRRRSLGY